MNPSARFAQIAELVLDEHAVTANITSILVGFRFHLPTVYLLRILGNTLLQLDVRLYEGIDRLLDTIFRCSKHSRLRPYRTHRCLGKSFRTSRGSVWRI